VYIEYRQIVRVTVVNRTDLQKSIYVSDICKDNEIVWINVKVNRWTKKKRQCSNISNFVMAEKYSSASIKGTLFVRAHQ
jgi:hypothetical protein